jgi:hypothetical protein
MRVKYNIIAFIIQLVVDGFVFAIEINEYKHGFFNNLFPMQANNSLYIFAKELDLPLPVFPNIPMCELNMPFIGM